MTAAAPAVAAQPPVTEAFTDPPAGPREYLWCWLAGIVGLLAPLSVNVGYFLREDKKRSFVAGMDLAVALLFIVALVNWRRIPTLLQAVPKTVWLFVGTAVAALIGLVAVGTASLSELLTFKMEIGKVLVANYIEYLVLAPVLVALLIDGRKRRLGALIKGVILAGLVSAIAGCVDFWNAGLLDVEIAGLFDHRNLLGGVFAMLTPLCVAVGILERSKITLAVTGVVLVLGLWCQTTAGALLGMVGGVLAVATLAWVVRARFRRCSFKIVALPIVVTAVLVVNHLLSPRAADASSFTDAQIAAGYRGYTLQPRSQLDAALESIAPWKYTDPNDPTSGKSRLSDRARRWQAQINLIRKHPFGCGTGLYQKSIGVQYGGPYARPTIRTDTPAAWGAEADEPGSVGMYEVVATEMGLFGLVALLALILAALARAGSLVLKAAVLVAAPTAAGPTLPLSFLPTADLATPAAAESATAPIAATVPAANPGEPTVSSAHSVTGATHGADNAAHGTSAAAARFPIELYAGVYSFAMLTGAALFGIFHNPIASRGPAGLFAIALALTVVLLPKQSASNN